MNEPAPAAPRFVPRLELATTDFELATTDFARIFLDWGDCAQVRDHLLIALRLSGLGVMLVLIDANWKIVTRQQVPLASKNCDPVNVVGTSSRAKFRILKDDGDTVTGLLWVEQPLFRRYLSDSPESGDGRTTLVSGITSWYSFKCTFFAGIPVLAFEHSGTEPERLAVTFCPGGQNGYWFSSAIRPPATRPGAPGLPEPSSSLLDIAEADAKGLPGEWRRANGLDRAYRESAPSHGPNRLSMNGVRPYDQSHAVSLISFDGKLHLVPIRLADGEALTPRRVSLRSGYQTRLGWTALAGSGTLWFYLNNEKLSAAKRDRSLWRIDYGSDLVTAKPGSDNVRVVRLSEDRVMTKTAVLDYGEAVFAMWEDGMNISTPNITRCFIYRREAGESDNSGVPVWTSEAADKLLESLPISEGGETYWMGKRVSTPDTRRLPSCGFKFGKRLGAGFIDLYKRRLEIGEIVM